MRSVKLKVDEKLTEVNSSHITYTLLYKNQCYSSFVVSCIDIFFIYNHLLGFFLQGC